MFAQGTRLIPKQAFAFRVNGKGREIQFKDRERLWVASSSTEQARSQSVEVCRSSQPKGFGYHFSFDQVNELFRVGD